MATKMATSPLGLKVKELRLARGLSQAGVDARMGSEVGSSVSHFELGLLRWVRPAQIEALAGALEVEPDELWAVIPGGRSYAKYIAVDQWVYELVEGRRRRVPDSRPVDKHDVLRTSEGRLGVLMLEVLQALWDLGSGSTQQVLARVCQNRPVCRGSVGTTLLRLTERGLLRREKRGVWIYYPAVEQDGMVMAAGGQWVEGCRAEVDGKGWGDPLG